MKVLLITTIDERNFYHDLELWKKIIKINPKSNVFSVNMYTDYLIRTKKCTSYAEAVLMAMSACKEVASKENCIIIGNAFANIKFDEIISVDEVDFNTLKAIEKMCKSIDENFPKYHKNTNVKKIQMNEVGAQLLVDLEAIKNVKIKS